MIRSLLIFRLWSAVLQTTSPDATRRERSPALVYAVCMYSERLQLLLTKEQRRRLDDEARRSGSSVAALVREAIDGHFQPATAEQRRDAARLLLERKVELIAPAELRELVDSRFDEEIPRVERRSKRQP